MNTEPPTFHNNEVRSLLNPPMSKPPITFQYKLFRIADVVALFRHTTTPLPDAYLAESADGDLAHIRLALSQGYRWIRTEGEFAIFEQTHPAWSATLPPHIVAAVNKFRAVPHHAATH